MYIQFHKTNETAAPGVDRARIEFTESLDLLPSGIKILRGCITPSLRETFRFTYVLINLERERKTFQIGMTGRVPNLNSASARPNYKIIFRDFILTMVEKSKAERQADLALYFAASVATEEDSNLMNDAEMEDEVLGSNGADL